MKAMYNGQLLFGPRGPAGPDGNPIGTVISYMGLTAPKDYLICDGAVHDIADYQKLAEFFEEQFGSANYFGGDGETTFAVPDMRNLFLRGYHGEAEEQLSGDIGAKQEATNHPYIYGGQAGSIYSSKREIYDGPTNIDTKDSTAANKFSSGGEWLTDAYSRTTKYTSRPVNMAVLYCIKAVESVSAENVYSTEETRIGTWIDGMPLYRKTVYCQNVSLSVSTTWQRVAPPIDDLKDICYLYGFAGNIGSWNTNISSLPVSTNAGSVAFLYNQVPVGSQQAGFSVQVNHSAFTNVNFCFQIEYTKTTDQATI